MDAVQECQEGHSGSQTEVSMAVWLIRAGSHGEYELKFIQKGRVYVWDDLDIDLGKLSQRSELTAAIR